MTIVVTCGMQVDEDDDDAEDSNGEVGEWERILLRLMINKCIGSSN